MNRMWAWRNIWDRTRSDGAKAEYLATLYDVRTRFPEDEWPCQNQGYWNLRQRAFAESFAAYLDAHRRDPADGNNLTYMGEGQRKLGRFPAAERFFMQGLENNAERGLAEWMVAALYLREIERLDAEDPPAGLPAFVAGFVVGDPKQVDQSLSRSREDLLTRAEYFNQICREVEPGNPYHHEVLGFLCLRRGSWLRAAEAFACAENLDASRWYPHFGRAVACEAMEKFDEARAILASACERFPRDPDAHILCSAFLGRTGHQSEAVTVLADGLGKVEGSRETLAEPLFAALCRMTSTEEAAARLRELVGRFDDGEKLLIKAAEVVDEESERGHAIALLRMVLERSPKNDDVRAQLGRMLVERLPTRAEGIELLEAAAKDAPHWGFARRPLALAYLHTDPARGLAVLEALADDEDAWTHEARSLLLQAMGDRKGSEKALRRALACYDEPPIAALADFAEWHIAKDRYARALELAERMVKTPHEDSDILRMDTIYLKAARLLGRAQKIVAWVRKRCPGNVPPEDLAWDVYFAYSNSEHDLAAGAAHVQLQEQETEEERTAWRIREAEQRAHLGKNAALEAEWRKARTVEAWVTLADSFTDLERYERADEAAERAYALDPKHAGAMVGLCHARQRRGDFAGALVMAQEMLERYPYDHRGPEMLGFIHARQLQVDETLAFSERALDAAPYCHNAYESRAMALFAAGRFDEARLHAEQALALSPEPEISESESRMILYALDRDRKRAASCYAKIPQGSRDAGHAYYSHLLDVAGERSRTKTSSKRRPRRAPPVATKRRTKPPVATKRRPKPGLAAKRRGKRPRGGRS
jgi:tetratricopeptide (TPR) repeat protein